MTCGTNIIRCTCVNTTDVLISVVMDKVSIPLNTVNMYVYSVYIHVRVYYSVYIHVRVYYSVYIHVRVYYSVYIHELVYSNCVYRQMRIFKINQESLYTIM